MNFIAALKDDRLLSAEEKRQKWLFHGDVPISRDCVDSAPQRILLSTGLNMLMRLLDEFLLYDRREEKRACYIETVKVPFFLLFSCTRHFR